MAKKKKDPKEVVFTLHKGETKDFKKAKLVISMTREQMEKKR